MNRAIWIVAVAALGLPAMGCGDSHTGDDAGGIMLMDSGGGTDGGGGGTDGGGGGTDGGGGGTDSGVVGDDGGIVLMDGGGSTDGGGTVGIACMGMTCDATTEQCCVTMSSGGAMGACIARDATCMGAVADCDGPEDCSGGDVCCARVGLGGASTTCEAAAMCTPGSFGPFELCHAPADCTDDMDMCCPVMRFGFSGAYCGAMCAGVGP
jgi:hypothetical protein